MTKALIVVDVQNEYSAAGRLPISYPDFGEAVANIVALMDAAAARGHRVVVVRHAAPAGSPVFVPGSPMWRLDDRVAGRPHDRLVAKATASAYYGTGLGEWLDGEGVDAVTITGFMTQNCVLGTAFDAKARGTAVRIVSDATGTLGLANDRGETSAGNLHETLMTVFASNLAEVVTTEQWLAGEAGVRSTFVASAAA